MSSPLADYRAREGLTRVEVARRVGRSDTYVYGIETGRLSLPPAEAKRWGAILKLDMSWAVRAKPTSASPWRKFGWFNRRRPDTP